MSMKPLSGDDPAQVADYQVRARLGAGGMGRIYLAYTPGPQTVQVVDTGCLRRWPQTWPSGAAAGLGIAFLGGANATGPATPPRGRRRASGTETLYRDGVQNNSIPLNHKAVFTCTCSADTMTYKTQTSSSTVLTRAGAG